MKQSVKKFGFKLTELSAGLTLAVLLVISGCGLTPDSKEAKYLAQGRNDMAKKDYARAVLHFQIAARTKQGDAEPYYQLALAYEGMGDIRSEYAALNKAIELNRKHLGAQVKLAELKATLGNQKDMQEAEKSVQEVLLVSPTNIDAINTLAVAEWRLGRPRIAETELIRALAHAPNNLRIALNLATVKYNQKDVAGAEEVLKNSAAANPKAAEPIVALARIYSMTGKSQAAEEQFRRAVQVDPRNDFALLTLADLYMQTNRPQLAEPLYKQLSTLPDSKYKPVHALFLFQTGKRDQAISEFEKLTKDDPSDRSARTRLIEAYFAVNRLAAAQKLLTAALKNNGKDVDALLQRSRLYLLAGNSGEAQKDIEQVLHFKPESEVAHYLMSRIYQAKGAILSQRQELSEALRLNKYFLPARLELTDLLLTNSAAAALQVIDGADSQKHELAVIIKRNWVFLNLQNMTDARKGIDEGLAQARVPDLLIQDGLLKLAQGKFSEARGSLEEALQTSPGDFRALQALNQTYVRQKQPAMGLQKVNEYVSKQPDSAQAQALLGYMFLARGDKTHARTAFEAAKRADPKSAQGDLLLSRLDVLDGNIDGARQRLQAVLATKPDEKTARLWLGNIYEMKGDHKAAIEQFKKVVETNPDDAQALNNLAYLLSEYGNQPDASLKYAQKAVELAPDRAAFCDTLGWILYRQGVYPSAVSYLERASSDPRDVVSKYHLAMAYAKAGSGKKGVATLEAALKLNPNVPEAKVAQNVVRASH